MRETLTETDQGQNHMYSCLVDKPVRFQLQAQYLVSSLLDVAGISPANVVVHAVDESTAHRHRHT